MQFRLKVIKGKPRGHCLKFPVGEFMFGRGPECDIRPISDLVSRQHCLLRIAEERAMIRDLGSRNGTLLNGNLILGEQPLRHGDTLQIGPLILEVIVSAESAVAVVGSTKETAMLHPSDTAIGDRPPSESCDQVTVEKPVPESDPVL
jgi:pSer/pThr/pTyr-binding forkhead associated (FHA) protein